MLLASWPMPEFAKFLQLITWIILPVLLLAVLVTMFLHYRSSRRKKSREMEADEVAWFDSPENLPGGRAQGAHILLDHSGVIREYQDKLSYYHARYAALQQDYKLLGSKYAAILEQNPAIRSTNKNMHMEETLTQQTLPNDQENRELAEKQVLIGQLEQLDHSIKNLESENRSLLEQLSIYTASEDEKDILVQRWHEENVQLKNQVTEQGYLKDLLKEKKNQVEFLQNQVDEQIILVHRLTQEEAIRRNELEAALQDRRKSEQGLINAREEMGRQDQVIDQLRSDLAGIENELREKEAMLGSRENELTYIQSQVRETKEQNELLQAELADSHDRVIALQEQLNMEESRVVRAMQKLEENRQLLKKFHRSLSDHIGESEETQVIELKPVYINSETEGWN